MSPIATTASIGVYPDGPEHTGFAHRIYRDLLGRKYDVHFEPSNTHTLNVVVAWSDEAGWTIKYTNRISTTTLSSPEHLYQRLHEDFILATQPWLPRGRERPF